MLEGLKDRTFPDLAGIMHDCRQVQHVEEATRRRVCDDRQGGDPHFVLGGPSQTASRVGPSLSVKSFASQLLRYGTSM